MSITQHTNEYTDTIDTDCIGLTLAGYCDSCGEVVGDETDLDDHAGCGTVLVEGAIILDRIEKDQADLAKATADLKAMRLLIADMAAAAAAGRTAKVLNGLTAAARACVPGSEGFATQYAEELAARPVVA